HHDTLAGSSIHSVYEKSRQMYARVIESGRQIAADALGFLAHRVNAPAGVVLVFNPTGWPRDAVVECAAPPADADASGAVAVAAGQVGAPIQIIDDAAGRAVFVARALPPYGYRCYEIKARSDNSAQSQTATVSKDGTQLENDRLRVVLDPAGGTVTSLVDKRTGREIVPAGGSLNRLEFDMATQPDGAWHFGKILSVEPQLDPVELRVRESGPARVVVEFSRQVRKSPITQRVILVAGSPAVDFEIAVDWKELGKNLAPSPVLRIAMDAALDAPAVATYEIPFGAIERPLSDHELVALKWADLSDSRFGISLLNDCKHGYAAEGRTLRMTLIRSSAFPDPEPDQYLQTIRYSLYPHEGGWKAGETAALAAALNRPVVTRVVEGGAEGPRDLPAEISFVRPGAPNVVISGIKRAEDDDDLVVRFFEMNGKAARSEIAATWPVARAARVNFLEDDQGATPTTETGVPIELRGHEIQTLKLRLKPVPGATMTGTRGPEPPRDF
ncbi:MAG: glycosyl hydrolase-related protein, partial [Candidatus Sumerlaeota bacterium]|nr:glycosyl hydrolase-related protein [Candidatus Sumerlaeota bacterium]